MKIIEEEERSQKWWMGTKTDWAIKKGDDWWIIPGSEFPEKKVIDSKKETKKSSSRFKPSYLMMVFFALILGVSLALNLIFYLTK